MSKGLNQVSILFSRFKIWWDFIDYCSEREKCFRVVELLIKNNARAEIHRHSRHCYSFRKVDPVEPWRDARGARAAS